MGQTSSNKQPITTTVQLQIKAENAELTREIYRLMEDKKRLEIENNRQKIVSHAKEQIQVLKTQRIPHIKQQISDLKEQKDANIAEFTETQCELLQLQQSNKDRINKLKQKQNMQSQQIESINDLRAQIHSLEQDKDLIDLLKCIDVIQPTQLQLLQFPITIKLRDHTLFCNTLQQYDHVTMTGLSKKTEWNGKTGIITEPYNVSRQRWLVTLSMPSSNHKGKKGLLKKENLILRKRGALSVICIGTNICIEQVKCDNIRIGNPYNAWYCVRQGQCTIHKQIKDAYIGHKKVLIMRDILQVKDEDMIRTLLINTDWNVKAAIDRYYEAQFMKETNGIKYIYVWQWMDDDNHWKGYNKTDNDNMEQLEIGSIYVFSVGAHRYTFHRISKDYGKQSNTKTNKKRKTQRIKVKQSEDWLYPQFWCNDACVYHDFDEKDLYYMSSEVLPIEQDYIKPKLVELDNKSDMFQQIIDDFYASTSRDKYDIVEIESVQNRYLWDKYYAQKNAMKKAMGKQHMNERNLWHGTDVSTIQKIITMGFRKEFNFSCYYGEGTYFALNSKYSIKYCKSSKRSSLQMLYCKVLCGTSALGTKNKKLADWPIKNDGTAQIYDSLVNNLNKPVIWVVHDDARVYPMFVIHFRVV